MNNQLPRDKIKNVLVFLCIVLFAGLIGVHLHEVNTLGSIFRRIIIPSFLFLFLIMVIKMTDFSNFRIKNLFTYFKPDIKFPFSQWILILGTGLIFGILIYRFANLAIMYIWLILFVLVSFFAAIIASFKFRPLYGFLIFLASAPITIFLERTFLYRIYQSDEGFFFLDLIAVTPMFIFIFSLFLISLLTKVLEKSGFENSPLTKPTIIFILIIIFTTLISSHDLLKSFRGIFSQIFIPLIFFFLTINFVKTKEDIKKTLIFILICLVGTCFISFYFYFWFHEVHVAAARGEIAAQQQDWQLTYVLSLTMGFPVCLAFIEIAKNKLVSFGAILGTIFLSIFAIILQFISVIIAIITGSALLIKNSSYKKVYFTIFAILLILAISIPSLSAIFAKRFEDVSLDFYYLSHHFLHTRILAWRGAIRMVKDYPLCGVGFGMEDHYTHIYSDVYFIKVRDLSGHIQRIASYMPSHQLYLYYAANSGILGLSALLFLVLSITIVSIKNVKNCHGKNDKIISLCLAGVIISYLAIGLASDIGFAFGINFINGGIFWTIVGLICVMRRLQAEERRR